VEPSSAIFTRSARDPAFISARQNFVLPNPVPVPRDRVQGYPTIRAFVNGKAKAVYQGDRSAAALRNYALGLLPNKVVTVNREPALRAFLARCGGSGGAKVRTLVHWD
jgi:hypothetical protein